MSFALGSLDDYITPSQACVNPLFASPPAPPPAGSARGPVAGTARVALVAMDDLGTQAGASGRPDLIRAASEGARASVSLADCLACSGCVTSAEAVLVNLQSGSEVLRALADVAAFDVAVASLSHQALASLAAHFGLASALEAYRRLAPLLRGLGFHYVIDTQNAGELALAEACSELVSRMRAREAAQPQPSAWRSPPPSVAVSSSRAVTPSGEPIPPVEATSASCRLPLLASACPGWVCYAEKTVPEALPLMSTVRSPQQLTGALFKTALAGASGGEALGGSHCEQQLPHLSLRHLPAGAARAPIRPSRVYHVAIMPCYDKKLEASRRDFVWEGGAQSSSAQGSAQGGAQGAGSEAREVDCVITPAELVELLATRGLDLTSAAPEHRAGYHDAAPHSEGEEEGKEVEGGSAGETAPQLHAGSLDLERLFTGVTVDGTHLVGPPASGPGEASDGWAEVLLRRVAWQVHGVRLPPGPVPFAPGRFPDFCEASVPGQREGGPHLLRFARATGFRSIQTVVAKLKRAGPPPWDYVEVMACPSGCVNGGGMVAPSPPAKDGGTQLTAAAPDGKKARVGLVAELLRHRARTPLLGRSAAWRLLQSALLRQIPAHAAEALVHTRFHAVPKLEATAIRW